MVAQRMVGSDNGDQTNMNRANQSPQPTRGSRRRFWTARLRSPRPFHPEKAAGARVRARLTSDVGHRCEHESRNHT